jgi:hypothetical protein
MQVKQFTLLRSLLLLLLLLGVGSVVFTKPAVAAVNAPADCSRVLYDRCLNEGYFTGTEGGTSVSGDGSIIFPITTEFSYADNPWAPGGAAISWSFPRVPGCQDSTQNQINGCAYNPAYTETFIDLMRNYVNGNPNCLQFPLNATDTCGEQRVNAIGSAMIINTMLGVDGSDFGNADWGVNSCGNPAGDWYNGCYMPVVTAGIVNARNNFNQWATLVRAYDEAGLVRWSTLGVYAPNHDNSTGMNYGTDAEFFNNTDQTIGQFIKFMNPTNPTQELFTINRGCGNIIGTALLPYPIPDSTLRGVKIDDSGLSSSGSSSGYGGSCHSATNGSNCNNGTLADYPFSDDCVVVDGSTCSSNSNNNPFSFVQNITPGLREVTIVPRGVANGDFIVRGYSICRSGGSCTSQFLTRTANVSEGITFTHAFLPGVTYHMRWIFAEVDVSCGNVSVVSEPGEYTNATIVLSSGAYHPTYTYNTSFGFADPAATYSSVSPASGTWLSSSNTRNFSVNGVGSNQPGVYTGTFTVNLSSPQHTASESCELDLEVANVPFIQAFRGDVVAGSPIFESGSCAVHGGSILTRNEGSADSYKGSGGQLGALGRGSITEFVSAALRSSAPLRPNGLTFANSPGTGNFSELSNGCVDYFTTGSSSPSTTAASIGGWLSNAQDTLLVNTSTDITPTTPGTNATNRQKEIYIDGDLFIGANITYATGPFSSIDDIPSLRFIVRGNIYIAPTVTELHGTYIAQPRPDTTGGNIYTCAPTNSSPSQTQLKTICANAPQLRFFGSVVAKQIHLHRLAGTMNSANPSADFNSTISAETFIESPLHWLVKPQNGGGGGVESIQSLPPVL